MGWKGKHSQSEKAKEEERERNHVLRCLKTLWLPVSSSILDNNLCFEPYSFECSLYVLILSITLCVKYTIILFYRWGNRGRAMKLLLWGQQGQSGIQPMPWPPSAVLPTHYTIICDSHYVNIANSTLENVSRRPSSFPLPFFFLGFLKENILCFFRISFSKHKDTYVLWHLQTSKGL